jgi:site-specific DNA-cytosine methylase
MQSTPTHAIRTCVLRIGKHRGKSRIYLEGSWLITAGFTPGSFFTASYEAARIRVSVSEEGRSVSGKRDNRSSVIDLHCQAIEEAFGNAEHVEVCCRYGTIQIRLSRTHRMKASREMNDRSVSMFAGGGLLAEAARRAGFRSVAAIEIDHRYADIYQANHGGWMINTSVEEVPWEELARHAPIGLLEMGIPCEPYSAIRRLDRGGQTKRDAALPPEAHELGDMVYWALKAADVLNPHTILIEEVPKFLQSGAGYILQMAMQRMGYCVEAKVIDPRAFGAMTSRRRAVVVATSFDCVQWPEAFSDKHQNHLGDYLEDVPEDSELWFDARSKPWLYEHWQRQTARGNGFEPPKLSFGSTSCPTIKKRYFAGQGDNPVVSHPNRPDTHRWLTVNEVRRLMGLPESFDLGTTKTTAGEILGQGVEVGTFTRLIQSITRKEFCND